MKRIPTSILLCLVLLSIKGFTQTTVKPMTADYVYHPPSEDKPSWQRLRLWLGASWYKLAFVRVSIDSSLIYVARKQGLRLLPAMAEGIEDDELLAQSQWFDERNPAKGARLLSQTKGKKHLEQTLLLGAYYTFPGKLSLQNKDSAEYYLKKALEESKTINEKALGRAALCLLFKVYSHHHDSTNGHHVFTQLTKECEDAGDKNTMARAIFFQGLYQTLSKDIPLTQERITGLINSRISYLQKAAGIYHSLNNIEGEIYATANAGYLHLYLNNLDSSYNCFSQALKLENSIDFPYTHYSTDNVAMIAFVQGKFGEPLKYAQESVRTAEVTRDSVGWDLFYGRLAGVYYTDNDREEESLKWWIKALNRFMLTDNENLYPTLSSVIEIMNEKPGREKEAFDLAMTVTKHNSPKDSSALLYYDLALSSAYRGIKQYKIAEKYAFSADSIQKLAQYSERNTTLARGMIIIQYADLYFAEGQYAKAKKYYQAYLDDEDRIAVVSNDMSVYQRLIKIDSVFDDPASAVIHYRKYTDLIDSNFKAAKIRQAEELQVMYQTKEKENEISMLSEKSKLETANLKQATLTKNVTIGGIIVALIIAGLLYRQSRLRKKNNLLVTSKNQQLQHLLTEKEWLLKEIHHRVKNNLQVVMSLLNSQSAFIDNEPALTAIHDSQHRVHAMSLIHQKLYSTDNVSSIDMSVYIRELATYLRDSFDAGQRVRFEFDIQPIEMDVSQAVPLGLILNEAITNSLKYAFPNDRNGTISISLSETLPDHYLLNISDDGVGMSDHISNNKQDSLGMSLMKGLSEDIDGDFSIESNNGTVIKISFVHDLRVKNAGQVMPSLN